MAGSTTSVERPPFGADVPVLGVDRLEFSADPAGLPPDTFSEFASGVDSLVLELGDELEVPGCVVELVPVPVVDVVPGWDRAVELFPDVDVFHDLSTADLESAVSLGSDVSSHGFIVSQLQGFW